MAEGIEPEYKKMLGSTMSWNLQAKRRKIHTNGEAKPNIPSAPARLSKRTIVCLDNLETDEKYGISMKKILEYIKSVRSEWFKIVWPSRDTVVRTTILILVFSALAALFFFVVDSLLNAVVGWVF